MKQTAIVKSHAEMAKFIRRLVRYSDKIGGNRTRTADTHYREAVRLLENAKRAAAKKNT